MKKWICVEDSYSAGMSCYSSIQEFTDMYFDCYRENIRLFHAKDKKGRNVMKNDDNVVILVEVPKDFKFDDDWEMYL